jgi:hypothetical protein
VALVHSQDIFVVFAVLCFQDFDDEFDRVKISLIVLLLFVDESYLFEETSTFYIIDIAVVLLIVFNSLGKISKTLAHFLKIKPDGRKFRIDLAPEEAEPIPVGIEVVPVFVFPKCSGKFLE